MSKSILKSSGRITLILAITLTALFTEGHQAVASPDKAELSNVLGQLDPEAHTLSPAEENQAMADWLEFEDSHNKHALLQ